LISLLTFYRSEGIRDPTAVVGISQEEKHFSMVSQKCGRWEIVGAMITEWGTSMDVIKFARKALKYCENKLVINDGWRTLV